MKKDVKPGSIADVVVKALARQESAMLGDKTKKNLNKGRIKGAKANKDLADEKKSELRQMGKDYLKAKPNLNLNEVVDYVWDRIGKKYKGKPIARSGVAKVLKGIKTEVNNELSNNK